MRHQSGPARVIILIALLACGANSSMAAPPSDEAIQAKVQAMNDWLQANRGQGIDREAMKTYAIELLTDVDISELSLDQLMQLQTVISAVPDTEEPVRRRFDELADQPDASGATASAIAFVMSFGDADAAMKASMLKRCFTHPGLKEAFAAGDMDTVFMYLPYVGDTALSTMPDELVGLESLYTDDSSPQQLQGAIGYVKVLNNLYEYIDAEPRERIRQKILGIFEHAQENAGEDMRLAAMLKAGIDFFKSPIGMGEFLNRPAPDIDFIWSSGDETLTTLSDLKGKVVVLDFWATWCGPCIRSFPSVAKLQERYRDYDVKIIGVTSLQGYHISPEGQRIVTKDDPDKEYALMKEFMPAKGMTWPVAFSEQKVYNPDYGISGIPHVAIIDAKGNVRYNGLHPSSEVTPMSEKTAKIDKLLKEAGLPAPEPYVEHEEAEGDS